jgi:hypothetical protein
MIEGTIRDKFGRILCNETQIRDLIISMQYPEVYPLETEIIQKSMERLNLIEYYGEGLWVIPTIECEAFIRNKIEHVQCMRQYNMQTN